MAENVLTTADAKADNIWKKIKEKAEVLRYGSFVCSLTVHDGEIRQAEMSNLVERIRAD